MREISRFREESHTFLRQARCAVSNSGIQNISEPCVAQRHSKKWAELAKLLQGPLRDKVMILLVTYVRRPLRTHFHNMNILFLCQLHIDKRINNISSIMKLYLSHLKYGTVVLKWGAEYMCDRDNEFDF